MKAAVVVIVLCAASAARAEDFVLENQAVRWTVTSAGLSRSLVEKPTGREWAKPCPLALLKKAGQWHPASSITRQGDAWRIGFGDSGVTADWRVTIRPRYFVVEVAAVRGEGVEEK